MIGRDQESWKAKGERWLFGTRGEIDFLRAGDRRFWKFRGGPKAE
jgi:hypothetical protein